MKRKPSRRRTLAALGSALLAGLAGCSSGGSDPTSTDPGEDGTPTPDADGGSDGETTSGGATPDDGMDSETAAVTTTSGAKPVTFKLLGGVGDTFESLVLACQSVTFEPTSDGGEAVTLDAGGTTVDLAALGEGGSKPILDGAPVPYGTYGAVTLSFTVEEATTTDGSQVTVEETPLTQSLVLNDDPAQIQQSGFDASLSLYVGVSGGEPYTVTSSGFQAVAM